MDAKQGAKIMEAYTQESACLVSPGMTLAEFQARILDLLIRLERTASNPQAAGAYRQAREEVEKLNDRPR